MKIEGSVQEIELFFKKFKLKDESVKTNSLPLHACDNKPPDEKMVTTDELPPHEFPLISFEEI